MNERVCECVTVTLVVCTGVCVCECVSQRDSEHQHSVCERDVSEVQS